MSPEGASSSDGVLAGKVRDRRGDAARAAGRTTPRLVDELERMSGEVDVMDLAADTLEVCDGRPLDSCSAASRPYGDAISDASAVVLFSARPTAPPIRAS
jgi:hypothetical protein